MLSLAREKLLEVLKAVAPLVLVGCVLQFTVVHAPLALFIQFLAGSALAIVGMVLFFMGIDFGILPMGKFVGAELPKRNSLALIVAVAFSLGFATTVAEPDVLVLAGQVEAVSSGGISWRAVVTAIGVGLAALAAVAMVRIIAGWSMRYMLATAYLIALALSLFAPTDVVPLAFDAGSVTTGALSAPVMIALAIGLSSVLAGRSAVSDGFGLLGFASAGAIIAILIMGMWPS
ncbi:MAG: DUF1538 domain-containing protein [Bradyrhizobiaceae bacterium]|nr:DUF1538 domain-containing protein [Bradyrhizobiaceae bacterium]